MDRPRRNAGQRPLIVFAPGINVLEMDKMIESAAKNSKLFKDHYPHGVFLLRNFVQNKSVLNPWLRLHGTAGTISKDIVKIGFENESLPVLSIGHLGDVSSVVRIKNDSTFNPALLLVDTSKMLPEDLANREVATKMISWSMDNRQLFSAIVGAGKAVDVLEIIIQYSSMLNKNNTTQKVPKPVTRPENPPMTELNRLMAKIEMEKKKYKKGVIDGEIPSTSSATAVAIDQMEKHQGNSEPVDNQDILYQAMVEAMIPTEGKPIHRTESMETVIYDDSGERPLHRTESMETVIYDDSEERPLHRTESMETVLYTDPDFAENNTAKARLKAEAKLGKIKYDAKEVTTQEGEKLVITSKGDVYVKNAAGRYVPQNKTDPKVVLKRL